MLVETIEIKWRLRCNEIHGGGLEALLRHNARQIKANPAELKASKSETLVSAKSLLNTELYHPLYVWLFEMLSFSDVEILLFRWGLSSHINPRLFEDIYAFAFLDVYLSISNLSELSV